MATAVAYIRRSSPGESQVSEGDQRATVAHLAAQHGHHIEHIYRDWGKSGGDVTRRDYLAMLDRIAQGGVDAVLAWDQDRLARDTWLFTGLLRLARGLDVGNGASGHRFAVLTPAGDLADPKNLTMAQVKAVLDERELAVDKERARLNADLRKKRQDDDGPAPYGWRRQRQLVDGTPLPPLLSGQKAGDGERFVFVVDDAAAIARVVDLYRDTRSLNATARALNVAGVPADRGGAWHACSVQRVVDRNAPELRAGVTGRGVRAAAKPRLLSRLLRCWCGQVLSPADGPRGATRWYCRAATVGMHDGPRGISENRLMAWVRDEAARLLTPDEVLLPAAGSTYDDRAERAALESLRGKVADAIVDAGLAELDAKRAAATGQAEQVVQVPPAVDWSAPVDVLNDVLRAMWDHIQLDEQLLPVAAEWHVPAWRR